MTSPGDDSTALSVPPRASPAVGRLRPVHFGMVVGAGLLAGGCLRLGGWTAGAHHMWAATTVMSLLAAGWWAGEAAFHRRLAVDLVALLALAGALAVGEYLAGAVIGFMLASGRSLEAWAAGSAERELRSLVERAPRVAHRHVGSGLEDVAVEAISVGDLVVVRPGDIVPVDGRVEGATAVVDESALTGEPLPVERDPGASVRSGTVNAGGPFELRVTAPAEQSTYAAVVRLVASAQAATAPSVRLADRYAAGFLAFTLAGSGLAWVMAGLPRAVAVLVVATPCPLILAVPVALVSGLSRAARRGVIVKGGAVLERLARARVLLIDKTGTLTRGAPAIAEVLSAEGLAADEIIRLAASLEQLSPHVMAASLVRDALDRGLVLSQPVDVEEVTGQGIRGTVDGRSVAVGKLSWVAAPGSAWARAVARRAERDGKSAVFVALASEPAGAFLLDDPVRSDAARTVRRLREDGIDRIIMVTGDRAEVADTVGAVIGVDQVLAERTPADKVDAVTMARRWGPTVMVGDGINDAPALALADVGVAMAARGATASSEAADAVLVVDRLDRLGEAVVTARRARRIATESVVVGMGLSCVAMAVAGAGFLPAVWGAVAQEGIDVAVIVNALRVLRPGRRYQHLQEADAALARRFSEEHMSLRADVDQIMTVADAIGVVPPQRAVALARDLYRTLVQEVLPHEQAEDAQLYPMLARVLGGTDRTATMSRAHVEIAHQVRRLGRLLADIGSDAGDADLVDLRGLLYGLYAILHLHFVQEDESYLSLADDEPRAAHPVATA